MTHNVKETRIKNLLKRSKGNNHEVLFHHRFSTSTADVPNACHPFSTKEFFKNNYVGVHNGVIRNQSELEKQQEKLGIQYVSRQANGDFNDSEALIYDIARYLEGQVEELTAEGSIAFIIVKRNKDGKATQLFFGRNHGNPLKMKMTKHSLTLSSQGEGKDVEANQLYSYDYETGEIKKRFLYIPSYSSSYGRNWNQGSEYYGYQGSHYGASSGFHRPAWDDDERFEEQLEQQRLIREEIEEFEDYNGYGTWSGAEAKQIINKGNFVPRTGTDDEIASELLKEAMGDYSQAAMTAIVEASEAEQEETRINGAIYEVTTNEAYDDLCDYWYVCNAYKVMMTKIADKFERASVIVDSKTPIVERDGIVVTKEERSLLPVNVMAQPPHNPKAV